MSSCRTNPPKVLLWPAMMAPSRDSGCQRLIEDSRDYRAMDSRQIAYQGSRCREQSTARKKRALNTQSKVGQRVVKPRRLAQGAYSSLMHPIDNAFSPV